MSRKFEVTENNTLKVLPVRATKQSAGYDFKAQGKVIIPARSSTVSVVKTGIKVIMPSDEFLQLAVRSSLAKKGLIMVNGVGVIDSDYYNNPKNEGEVQGMFINISYFDITIEQGESFMQGVFLNYKLTDDDNVTTERIGGVGSTN